MNLAKDIASEESSLIGCLQRAMRHYGWTYDGHNRTWHNLNVDHYICDSVFELHNVTKDVVDYLSTLPGMMEATKLALEAWEEVPTFIKLANHMAGRQ